MNLKKKALAFITVAALLLLQMPVAFAAGAELSDVVAPVITDEGAALRGGVISSDGVTISACGFVYDTTSDLSITDDASVETDDAGDFSVFSAELTGLDEDTDYYVCAYAQDDGDGTYYGPVTSFRTADAGVTKIDLETIEEEDGTGFTCASDTVNSETEYFLTITDNGEYELTGTVSQDEHPTRVIVSAETADITLNGVNINIVNASPLSISPDSAVNLTLADGSENTLSAAGSELGLAGLYVPEDAAVSIDGTGTLNASGGGSTGYGNGAGVGGMSYDSGVSDAGAIFIEGGTVNATGRFGAAGIGGAEDGDGGQITINDGIITAIAGDGAGIGGGRNGDGGIIAISGGTITATGGYGAGIGGGSNAAGGAITITGGTINAVNQYGGFGIGEGYEGDGGTIIITGGSVNTSSVSPAPTDGIETVYLVTLTVADSSGSALTDTAVTCTMPGGLQFDAATDGAGKLYLWLPEGEAITVGVTCNEEDYEATGDVLNAEPNSWITGPAITGVTVIPAAATVAKGDTYPFYAAVTSTNNLAPTVTWTVTGEAGDTSINSDGVLTVALDETASTLTVTATSTVDNTQSDSATVTLVPAGTVVPVNIDLSTVDMNGKGYTCAEIKVNDKPEYVVTITENGTYILSGTVSQDEHPTHVIVSAETADITLASASISIVNFSPLSIAPDSTVNLTLAAGSVNTLSAAGSELGLAGLYVPEGATVKIAGAGTLTASGGGSTGYGNGAGIGGMSYSGGVSDAGTIIISGGTVNAAGRLGGAGIGGGYGGDGGSITITGGIISASGGEGGAGIGGGYSGSGGNITITGGTIHATGGYGEGIGAGHDGNGGNILIKGGSVNTSSIVPEPTDGDNTVYLVSVTVVDSSGNAFANTDISCKMPSGIKFNARTDDTGKLYLWLPAGRVTVKVTYNGVVYKATGNVASTGSNSMTATRSYSSGGSGNGTSSTTKTTTQTYNADVSGGGTLPVTVDTKTNNAAVSAGAQQGDALSAGSAVVIELPSIPDVTSYTLGIPASYISNSDAEGTLAFNTDAGSLVLPANMLASVFGAEGKTAAITISEGDPSGLSDELIDAIGKHPLVQLTLTLDGQRTEWSNPDAPVTVSIPYTPTARELENPEGLVIWYIDGGGNAVSVPNGHYDPETGTVTFTITHFSSYAVAYNEVGFKDVAAEAWYAQAVSFIAARDITNGTGGGNYSPAAELTRGEFLVMLMKAYGMSPDTDTSDNFSDAGSTWYTGYLAAAKRLGISNGVGDNLFAPDKKITRQEMFTLLYNALKAMDKLPEGGGNEPVSFNDAGEIASWAADAVQTMAGAGIITGGNGNIFPTDTTTRAEMAQVLYNLLSR